MSSKSSFKTENLKLTEVANSNNLNTFIMINLYKLPRTFFIAVIAYLALISGSFDAKGQTTYTFGTIVASTNTNQPIDRTSTGTRCSRSIQSYQGAALRAQDSPNVPNAVTNYTGIAWQPSTTGTLTGTLTIWMQVTATATSSWNTASATQVYTGTLSASAFTAGAWYVIPFTTNFSANLNAAGAVTIFVEYTSTAGNDPTWYTSTSTFASSGFAYWTGGTSCGGGSSSASCCGAATLPAFQLFTGAIGGPCTAPTTQALNIVTTPSANTASINWTNGNGGGRVVYVNTTNSFTAPADGTNPTANRAYSSGQQCVFNGSGSGPITVTGLSASTTYHVRVYEYCTPTRNYITTTGTNNPNSFATTAVCTAPNGTVAFGTFSGVSSTATTTNVTYTNGGNAATGYVLLRNTSNTAPTAPASGTVVPSAGSTSFVSGYTVVGTSTTLGSSQAFNSTGLTASTTYYYWVVAYQNTNGPCWFTPATQASNSQATSAPPPSYCTTSLQSPACSYGYIDNISVSNLNQTATGCSTGYADYTGTTVNFTQGANYSFTITSAYLINDGFGWWIDYNDNGSFSDAGEFLGNFAASNTGTTTSSISISGTAAVGNHRMRVRGAYFITWTSTNGCTAGTYGETHDYTVSITAPCTAPTSQATIGSYTNNVSPGTSLTVGWSRGTPSPGNEVIVVGRLTATADVAPTSGTTYTANAAFGTVGTTTGTGNFVVYKGTGTSVNVTALTAGTSYTFTVYEYNSTGTCYKTPGSSSAVTTWAPPTYCTPTYSIACNYSFINAVSISNINQAATGCSGAFVDYTATTINLTAGTTYPFTVTTSSIGLNSQNNLAFWIDFNDDGDFQDANEFLGNFQLTSANTWSNNLSIPAGATAGNHRMRVRGGYSSAFTSTMECTNNTYGETHDYTAAITVPIPNITLADNATQVTIATQPAGTTNVVLHKFSLAVTTTNATLTGLQCTTAGNYQTADISNLKVWYQSTSTFSGTGTLLSTYTSVPTAGTLTFPLFAPQIINSGSTGYIYITADIAAGATVGRTVNVNAITIGQLTFSSGNKSGLTTNGGLQTISALLTPSITINNNGTQVSAGNVNTGATDQVLHQSSLAVTTANTTLTGMTFTTTGTYTTADLTNLKVRYSTDATLDAGDATLSTYTSVPTAGNLTFPSFVSQAINSGTTGYIFITADIATNATDLRTIGINALTTANFTFSSGNKSGTTNVGGTQTIVIAPNTFTCADFFSIGTSTGIVNFQLTSATNLGLYLTCSSCPSTITVYDNFTSSGSPIYSGPINGSGFTVNTSTGQAKLVYNQGFTVNATPSCGTAYYWVGGTTVVDVNAPNVWSTTLGGTPIASHTPLSTARYIIDGTDISNSVGSQTGTVTFALVADRNMGSLELRRNASVVVRGTSATTRYLIINGLNGNNDLIIGSGSALSIGTVNSNETAGILITSGSETNISNSGTFNVNSSATGYGVLEFRGNSGYSGTAPVYGGTDARLVYSGVIAKTTGVELPSSMSGSLIINNTNANAPNNTITLGGNTTVSGNITLTSGVLDIASRILTVAGNLVTRTSGVIDADAGTMRFTNSNGITLPSSVFSGNVNNLTMDGAGGITLGSATTVTNALTLTNGKITIGNNNLTLNSASGLSGGNSSSYIVTNGTGLFQRTISGASAYNFPLGSASAYNPASVVWSSAPGVSRLDSRYIASTVSTGSGLPLNLGGFIVSTLLDNGYWDIAVGAGTLSNSYDISLTRNGHTNAGSNLNSHGLVKRTNSVSAWTAAGTWSNPGVTAIAPANTGQVSITQTGLNGFSEFAIGKGTSCIINTWTSGASGDLTNWFNEANWSCGIVPTSSVDVVIPTTPIGGNYFPIEDIIQIASVRDITISPSATITFSSAATLVVNGDFTNNGTVNFETGELQMQGSNKTLNGNFTLGVLNIQGNTAINAGGQVNVLDKLELQSGQLNTNNKLTLKSSATKTAFVDDFSSGFNGTVTGDLSIERYVPGTGNKFHYFGALSGGTASKWNDDYTITSNAADNTAVTLDPSKPCGPTALAVGSAYGNLLTYDETLVTNCFLAGWRVRNTSAPTERGRGFAGRVPSTTVLTETGTYDKTNVTLSGLSVTGINTDATSKGFHFVSNPFWAPILWSGVTGSNLYGTAYRYDPNTGSYGAYNNITAPMEISTNEAFFVRGNWATVNDGNSTFSITFPASARTTGENNTFLRSGLPYAYGVKITVNAHNTTDHTLIAFDSRFTTAHDNGYDALKLDNDFNVANIYTIDATAQRSAILALPENTATASVPLNIDIRYTDLHNLTFDLQSFPSTAMVFLEDKTTGVWHNLRINNSYSFNATVGDNSDRFVLHFTPAAVFNATASGCENNTGIISIQQDGGITWDYEIKDQQNTTVLSGSNLTGYIEFTQLAAGNYTIALVHESGYTATENITVIATENIALTVNATANTIFVNEPVTVNAILSSNGTTNWDMGDGTVYNNTETVIHSYTVAGNYLVSATAANDNCNDTKTIDITVEENLVTGIAANNDKSLKVYASGNTVFVEQYVSKELVNADLTLYNTLGQIIQQDKISELNYGAKQQINVNASSGIYYLHVVLSNGKEVQTKLLINR